MPACKRARGAKNSTRPRADRRAPTPRSRRCEKAVADATIVAPVSGVVTDTIADEGELIQPRAPIVVITDLDHAWANVYVDEPVVPRLRVGDVATLFTDAGGPGVKGTISYISERAEFTPRNVQTADDRSKLVYRVKVSVDNTQRRVQEPECRSKRRSCLSADAVVFERRVAPLRRGEGGRRPVARRSARVRCSG